MPRPSGGVRTRTYARGPEAGGRVSEPGPGQDGHYPGTLAALEQRQRFYVVGMREHVRDADGPKPIPLRVD